MSINRISLLGVPVDICQPENLEKEVMEILARPGTKQIVFLSIWDLIKARKKGDFADCIKSADLILPVSKSILRAAAFLKKPVPVRYYPFSAVIQILSVLDNHFKTLYLLGSSKKTITKVEHNIKDTFPSLKIIGRYVGYFPKTAENDIIQAIFKSQPSLVLMSDGIREKICWPYRRRNQFASSTFLYYKDAFGIFSERVRRVNEKNFEKGLEFFIEIAHNPFKTFLIIPLFFFSLTVLWYKILKK